MNAPRLLVDARLPWGSGIGRYIRNIIPPVAGLMASARFTLLVQEGDQAPAQTLAADYDNIEVLSTDIRPFSSAEQVRLPALARQWDLTWFTNYWVPLRWKGPFIATVHDLMHMDSQFPASRLKRYAAARTFAKVRRDAAHVLFVSRFTAREFVRMVGQPRKSSIVHHGMDHLPADSGMPMAGRKQMALAVAATKKHKNLPLLLEAWKRAQVRGWQLIIVTPKDDLRSSVDLGHYVAQDSSVEIMRGISDAHLAELYRTAGFVVTPSRYEGFGLPLLEAMRLGAPVISSTADALVEVASGAIVPFVNADDLDGWVEALRSLAADCDTKSGLWDAVVQRNRAHSNSFTWAEAGRSTADALMQAWADSPPAQ